MSDLTSSTVEDPAFWHSVCPELGVERGSDGAPYVIDDLDRLVDVIRFEGYVNVPDVVPGADVARLRSCIDRLHEQKIPVVFAFVYDELWLAFQRLSPFLTAVLGPGYRALPAFWAWRLEVSGSDRGWEPHRDCAEESVDRDNSPYAMTVWLALSDATPTNGCIYVVPAHLDERFRRRVWEGDEEFAVRDLHNVRAVPATAGSMLAWNQHLLHWGGRVSRHEREPRRSVAFEFQRGDKAPFQAPLIDTSPAVPFTTRLGLVAKQLLQYRHMHPLTDEMAEIAVGLRRRYMPEA